MGDWQQYLQSIFFGVVFSFLLAKLLSVIFAFRDENLRITRSHHHEQADEQFPFASSTRVLEGENEPLIGEKEGLGTEGARIDDYSDDSDDDWEGVESTELDETFSAATAFVAATAADRSHKVSNGVQLQLYGLYKIATEGPCSAPQPSALKMTARAKWQAWHKLGTMPPEEAMEKYIDIVTDLYPTWLSGSATKRRNEEGSNTSLEGSKGPMGPVFSTFIHVEESGLETKMDAIHDFAREGDEEKLLKCIESGVSLNIKDSEGRTPLHWAVDRGHMNITSLLLSKNADVNAKDDEGQTPLHYAAVCERDAIAEVLVKHGADLEAKDDDGKTPSDLCDASSPSWMQHGADVAGGVFFS